MNSLKLVTPSSMSPSMALREASLTSPMIWWKP